MQDPEAKKDLRGVANRGFEPDHDFRDEQALPAKVAVVDDDGPDEYVDVDTGKVVKTPKPWCGCRALDHRFPLEMDDETSYVYREAKYCKLSYTFISSWCLMLFFATAASAGIIAIGFLNKKLIHYQVVGIILTVIFGAFLPVFIVFWVCLQRRVKEVRQEYHAQRNRNLVFQQEMNVSLSGRDDIDLAKTKMENQNQTPPSPPASPPPPPPARNDVDLLIDV